jgi:hypothetical protein
MIVGYGVIVGLTSWGLTVFSVAAHFTEARRLFWRQECW